jgi:hypothetical protein
VYGRLVLGELRVEIGLEAGTVLLGEGDRGGDVYIVEEVGDVKENGVARLLFSVG